MIVLKETIFSLELYPLQQPSTDPISVDFVGTIKCGIIMIHIYWLDLISEYGVESHQYVWMDSHTIKWI